MNLWQDAVTDRTVQDVERVLELLKKNWSDFTSEERTEWIGGMKGSINAADLNRIQGNIALLAEVLELELDIKPVVEFPNKELIDNILSNTRTIRDAYMIHADTPRVPTQPINTWTKWNDIEKILADVYDILLNNFSYYCGSEIYCGDATGLLL